MIDFRADRPLFLFFFQAATAHRHLHSFPTRRSSDLSKPVRLLLSSGLVLVWSMPVVVAVQIWYWMTNFENRSEEHTSELQSRRDLVCRLLLEKKKPDKRPWPNKD